MKIRAVVILGMAFSFLFICVKLSFSQETSAPDETVASETKNEPETQWVWGEVTNLDPANKTVLVKYLDYETDQEKEITVGIDDKTTFENIGSLDEIKPNDELSIDYIVTPDEKNIARRISLEKPESATLQGETVEKPANTQSEGASVENMQESNTPEE